MKKSILEFLLTRKIDAFYENVSKRKTKKGCILWKGCLSPAGYGRMRWLDKKNHLAHRISYELNFGAFDKRLCVLHKCDTPACINPDHLWLGTLAENTKDMHKKGRGHWHVKKLKLNKKDKTK